MAELPLVRIGIARCKQWSEISRSDQIQVALGNDCFFWRANLLQCDWHRIKLEYVGRFECSKSNNGIRVNQWLSAWLRAVRHCAGRNINSDNRRFALIHLLDRRRVNAFNWQPRARAEDGVKKEVGTVPSVSLDFVCRSNNDNFHRQQFEHLRRVAFQLRRIREKDYRHLLPCFMQSAR